MAITPYKELLFDIEEDLKLLLKNIDYCNSREECVQLITDANELDDGVVMVSEVILDHTKDCERRLLSTNISEFEKASVIRRSKNIENDLNGLLHLENIAISKLLNLGMLHSLKRYEYLNFLDDYDAQEEVADVSVIGLNMMNQNLILNLDNHGFVVCTYSCRGDKVTEFLENKTKNTQVIGAFNLEEMVMKLKKPRYVILLEKFGITIDTHIDKLIPLLEPGDTIIDGGKSEYQDTERRTKDLNDKGIWFTSFSLSGEKEEASYGSSLSVGNRKAWSHIKSIFQATCAQHDGEPCCDWVSETYDSHFVNKVCRGVEYGESS